MRERRCWKIRYRETRRVHPLSPGGPSSEGIETERRAAGGRDPSLADHVIDTSPLNVHQLRELLVAPRGRGRVAKPW